MPKKIKKDKPMKTKEERLQFVNEMKDKFLNNYGMTETLPCVQEMNKIFTEYVETGRSASGKIPFPEAPYGGRTIEYILSARKHITNKVEMPLNN